MILIKIPEINTILEIPVYLSQKLMRRYRHTVRGLLLRLFGFFTDLSLSLQTEMTSRECTESRKVGSRAEVVYYISRKFFFGFEYMIFTRLGSDEET